MAKRATAAERRHMNKLAEQGCALCAYLGFGETRAEIHHLREGMGAGQRNSNLMTIPPCPEHHRGNTGYHGLGRRAFERAYGLTEMDLWAMAKKQNPATVDAVPGLQSHQAWEHVQMTMQIVPTSQINAIGLMADSNMSMTSQEIADLVEKRHDNVRRTIQTLAEQGVIEFPQIEEISTATKPVKAYRFIGQKGKRDSIIVVAQLSPEFTARLVDRWQELEQRIPAIPNFSNPADAARAWAEQYEARQIAERTKAEIGSRREATAMSTASQAVRQAKKLAIELDKSKEYASIKRMEMLYHGQKFNWRHLKNTATEMGIQSIDIFDANYGTVKAYHADVWQEAYALSIEVS